MRAATRPDAAGASPPVLIAAVVDPGPALYDAVACGVVVQDAAGVIIYANPAAQDLLGLSLDQLQGRDSLDPRWRATREDGSDLPGTEHPAMVALRTGQPQRGVTMAVALPDEEHRWLQVDAVPLRDAGDAAVRVVTSFTDIAARHQAEQTLRQETERRAAIIALQQDVATAGLDLEAVLARITAQAQALTGASGAVVEMIDGEDLVYRAASGTVSAHVGLRLARATSLSGLCTRGDAVLCCDDTDTDERVDRAACRRIGARALILAPVRQAGQMVGVLTVLAPQPHAFETRDVEALQVVAGVLGAALGQATAFAAVQASEERYRQVQEHAPIGLALVAPDGRWLRVNPALCALVGYTAEALLARTFQDITHPDDLGADLAFVRQLLAGEIARYQIEKRYIRADGTLVWVLLSVSLVRDGGGRPLYFISQIQDIDGRKKAEAALQASEDRFRENFDRAALGMAVIGLDGHYRQVNTALCRIVGYGAVDLLALRVQDLTFVDDMPTTEEGFARLRAGTSETYQAEKRYHHKDGHAVWVEVNATLVRDDRGGPLHLINQTQDITARKQAEAALAENRRELVRSNAELQQFAYVASHDLQEPLRTITSYLQLLQRRYRGALGDDADTFIGFAVDGARRMSALIKAVLAYSRVGTHGAGFAPVDSQALVAGVVATLHDRIEETGARVTCGDLPPVWGDATQLGQLVQNLIGNALKFRRRGAVLAV